MQPRTHLKRARLSSARRLLLPLALGAALCTSSCRVHHDAWAFSVSREVYGEGGPGIAYDGHFHCREGGEAAALVLLAMLVLPVAIDLVLLPVTLTHDLCDS
jgi:hypothetical protein